MFGKLLKNDLKAQWFSVAPIFLCIIIISIVAELFVLLSENSVVTALGGLVVTIALLFACFVIIIAVAMMFAKTVFGKAGFLTLSLPVKTRSLIWSKTLSGLIWTYVVYMLFFGSLFLWIHQVGQQLGTDFQDMADQIFSLLLGKSISTMISMLSYYLVWFGIIMFLIIQCLYLGITCSYVSPISKLGVLGAVIIFFGSFALTISLTGVVTKFLPFGMVICEEIVTLTSNVVNTQKELGDYAYAFNFAGPLAILMISVVLNLPITYLAKNKVNI